jgi:predicted RNA-binding protein with PIN domain
MNLVGSRPDGWWRDRRGAMQRLVDRLGEFASQSEADQVIVVFDGAPFAVEAGAVEVAFAPARGRNAADDEIARMVAADARPASLTVVTSDRELARRVDEHGAAVVGAGAFLRTLDAL